MSINFPRNLLNFANSHLYIIFLVFYFYFPQKIGYIFFSGAKKLLFFFVWIGGSYQGTQNTIGSTVFCFQKSKQIICLLDGWIRQKTVSKCKQMYFITQTVQLIFGGLNINNKQCSTFTFMYLGSYKCVHVSTN